MIAVRELACVGGVFSASLEIGGVQFGPVEIRDPFGAENDGREAALEWYFEDWLKLPMLGGAKAASAERGIVDYGDALFQQLFAATSARLAYERWRSGPGPRRVEIAGSPAFQALHWETLRDPDRGPLATEASLSRASRKAGIDLAEFDRAAPTIRVLVVTARPGGAKDVGYRTISRPLIEALGDAGLSVEIDLLRPGTYPALAKRLEDRKDRPYHVVHFDLHGALLSHAEVEAAIRGEGTPLDQLSMRYGREQQIAAFDGKDGFLVFEPEKRPLRPEDPRHDLASAEEVAALLAKYRVPIAILNACQSGKQTGGERETSLGARLLDAGARNVVAMSYSITVSAAARMMPVLYRALLEPTPLGEALRRARLELANETGRRAYFNQQIQLKDWILPVLYQREDSKLEPRRMYPEEEEIWLERQARLGAAEPRTATGGFLGRDLDILEIERRLQERELLLIHGGGGTGKTALLKHLAAWWERTGWIEGADYFGYDAQAWTLEAILAELADQVLPPQEAKRFAILSALAQGEKIAQALRRRRRLLILDNLESVTAEAFAIRNQLSEPRRAEIATFLARLVGGASLVLLGSRGPVPWLASAIEGRSYPLRGLDAEAASDLTERILARAGLAANIGSDAMRRLTRLLAGHPLALEVVLPNLAQQSPEDVLAALSEGAADLDAAGTERTESILACVEYSHANLDPGTRRLLECLAPFKAAVRGPFFDRYVEELANEPLLADLPTDAWGEAFSAAATWGLVQPHPDPGAAAADYLAPQPILPWFLERRLTATERAEIREAIHRAFRRYMWGFGDHIIRLMNEANADQRRLGRLLTAIELETFSTALDQALVLHERILNFVAPILQHYTETRQNAAGERLVRKVIAALETYPPETLDDERRLEMVGLIGDASQRLMLLNQLDAAQKSSEAALRFLAPVSDQSAKDVFSAQNFFLLGRIASERRQFTSAEESYRKALQIFTLRKLIHLEAKTYHQLGFIAHEQRAFSKAEDLYRKSLSMMIELNDASSVGMAYHELGRLALARQDFVGAEELFRGALEPRLKMGEAYLAAQTYGELGNLAKHRGNAEEAEKHFRKALDIFLSFQDERSAATTYHNLGTLAQDNEEFDIAEEAYSKAIEIFTRLSDEHAVARSLYQIGTMRRQRGDLDAADETFGEASEIFLRYDDELSTALILNARGRVAEERHDLDAAEKAYLKALDTFLRFQDQYAAQFAIGNLARLAVAHPSRRELIVSTLSELVGISRQAFENLLHEQRDSSD
jgi:tetratricopeptide (TPR) repeat protein